MVASSGSSLMKKNAVQPLVKELLSIATLVTPNIPEAKILSGLTIETKEDMINTINSIQPKSKEEQLTPTAFAGALFELLAGRESQIELAQDFLKKEIQQKFQ